MRCVFSAALCAVAMATAAEAVDGGPADATRAFYDVYMKEYGRDGVPGEAVRAHFAAAISSALDRHLADAQRAEALHFRLTKNEEPPLAEGDLFSSPFEGARSYRVGSCVTERDRVYCDVALTYGEAGGGEPVTGPTRHHSCALREAGSSTILPMAARGISAIAERFRAC